MNWYKSASSNYDLSEESVKKFLDVAKAQRSGPESIMLQIQRFTRGNILNYIVEHGGDILHRITHHADVDGSPYIRSGLMDIAGMGSKKIINCIRYLSQPYGFEKEMMEGLSWKAKDEGIPLEDVVKELSILLKKWGNAYASIPVHNRPQRLARDACIAVGDQNWGKAKNLFEELNSIASDPERFFREALTDETANTSSKNE